MDDALLVLAQAGAGAVVAAMATDAWNSARIRAAHLFRRSDSDPAEEGEPLEGELLERDNQLVVAMEDREEARARLLPGWELRLRLLLEGRPEAAEEIRRLVDDIEFSLGTAGRSSVQINSARDHGQVFAAQGGNVIVHRSGPGDSAPGRGDAEG
ncbi:hypothetical protein OG361_37615 [Streptomyces sp. NBC_00090]|uniref:hypothetical protein n=1 Tax=Streptomyces sp. NBC_00090 TaxID=2903619 RepID=UPI0032459575